MQVLPGLLMSSYISTLSPDLQHIWICVLFEISSKFAIPTLQSSGIANLQDESRTGWFTPAALVIGTSGVGGGREGG